MEEEENFSLDNCPLYNDGYVAQLLRPSLNEDSAGVDRWLNNECLQPPSLESPMVKQPESPMLEQEKEIFYLKTILALRTECEDLKKGNEKLIKRNTWLEDSVDNCKKVFFSLLAGNIQTEARLDNDKSINESIYDKLWYIPESVNRENLPKSNDVIALDKNESETSIIARRFLEESGRKRKLSEVSGSKIPNKKIPNKIWWQFRSK